MSTIKQFSVTEPYLKGVHCDVGESLHYDPPTRILSFLDTLRDTLHTVDLSRGPLSHRTVEGIEISPGKLADLKGRDDVFICGASQGFGVLSKKTGKNKYLKRFWAPDEKLDGGGIRSNDGGIDSRGRFWLGTMQSPMNLMRPKALGSLYRLDNDLSLHCVIEGGISIPNGLSWSPDDKTMYFTDSAHKSVFAFDFDAPSGNVSNKRVFFHAGAKKLRGSPDGHAMDEKGCLWIALFGGSKVVRVSPGGEVLAEVKVPTRCVTDVLFVGDEIFITTAKEALPHKFPDSVPLQGCTFKCRVGVRGFVTNQFILAKGAIEEKSLLAKL